MESACEHDVSTPLPKAAPSTPEALGGIAPRIERAQRLGRAGRSVEAAQLYEAILAALLATEPHSAPTDEKSKLIVTVTLAVGEIYAGQGQFDSALRMAEMALCYNPSPVQRTGAFVLKGQAYCGIGNTEGGIQAFTTAAQQEPVGGRLAAVRMMARLVALAPTAGQPQGQRERLQQCAETWSEILLSDPGKKTTAQERAEAWTILGMMSNARRNRLQAIDYFKAALSAAPGYAEAARQLEELSRAPRVIVPNLPPLKPKPPPCRPLLDSATRLLYARNAFRITALPVDASARDIVRQADRLKILAELNHAPVGNFAAFPLSPAPSLDEIRDSLQRLKEPSNRLIAELFWFWPEEFGNSRGDAALQALLRGDHQVALEIWREKEYDPAVGVIASHNLAVYWHCTALDRENQALVGSVEGTGAAEAEAAWAMATARWIKLVENTSFWDRVRTRTRQLDPERLTDSFCESLQGWLLQAIDLANGDLALAFAAANRPVDARRHARRIEQTEARRNEVGNTAELVLAPRKKRLEQQVAFARSQGQQNPQHGPEAARELFHHVREVASLVDVLTPPAVQSAPPSPAVAWKAQFFKPATDTCAQLLLLSLPRSDVPPRGRLDAFSNRIMPQWRKFAEPNTAELRGPVAKELVAVLTHIGAAAHLEKDSETAVEAFELAVQVCDEPAQKEKISTDLKTLRQALELTMCHYCHRVKGDLGKHKRVWMWGDIIRSAKRVNFSYSEFQVPRCSNCKSVHNRCFVLAALAAFCGGVLAKSVCQALGSPVAFPAWVLAALGAGWLVGQWFLKRHKTNDATDFRTFLPVADALKLGWRFGKRPQDHSWNPKTLRRVIFLLAGTMGAITVALAPLSPPARWIRYEWAISHNTRQAYETFLSAFPGGDYSEEANRRLKTIVEEEEWSKIRPDEIDLPMLRNYIANYPDGVHLEEANQLLDKELQQRWMMLETTGTLEDIRKFHKANSDFVDDQKVLARFETLLWEQACAEIATNGKCNSLREFVDSCPKSQFAGEATRRLNELSEKRWPALEQSMNTAELREFIRVFRGCPREAEAKSRLLQVRNGWTSDLHTERQNIEIAQSLLVSKSQDLMVRKLSLDAEANSVDRRNHSLVNEHNQKVAEYNRLVEEQTRAESLLKQRIDVFNERLVREKVNADLRKL